MEGHVEFALVDLVVIGEARIWVILIVPSRSSVLGLVDHLRLVLDGVRGRDILLC